MTYTISNNIATIKINPKIYSEECIFATSYTYLDIAYLIIETENKNFKITLETKNNDQDIEILAKEFHNELINYKAYLNQAKNTKQLRETILKRALITNSEDETNN